MKRIFLGLQFTVIGLVSLLFFGCYYPDSPDSFPIKDYSDFIETDNYVISGSAKSLQVFNFFYDTLGYGEFNISGIAKHTETATLLGETISKSIECEIKKINIYTINKSTSGDTRAAFYVDIYNSNNEILSYSYSWQFSNTNGVDSKTSEWCQSEYWYKIADSKTQTNWTLIIPR